MKLLDWAHLFEMSGLVLEGDEARWALFSPDGRYRYALGVQWQPACPVLDVIAKNPSTATHLVNDPTLRKLTYFAKRDGFGGLLLRNLAAFRSTDPLELGRVVDPIGPRNVEVLAQSLDPGDFVQVGAWGRFESRRIGERLAPCAALLKARGYLFCFGLTKDGEPRHPLYLPNATRIMTWAEARRAQEAA